MTMNKTISKKEMLQILEESFPIRDKTRIKNLWPRLSVDYAHQIIKDRWPEAEHLIMSGSEAWRYARDVIKDRWPEAEPYILQHHTSIMYARDVIKGRWLELENLIIGDSFAATQYAIEVLQKRWYEAESTIQSDDYDWEIYLHNFPDAQFHNENTPLCIGNCVITDISNKTSSEQLQQLIKMIFYNDLQTLSEQDATSFFVEVNERRILSEKRIIYLINNTPMYQRTIDQIRKMSFDYFCVLVEIHLDIDTDFC